MGDPIALGRLGRLLHPDLPGGDVDAVEGVRSPIDSASASTRREPDSYAIVLVIPRGSMSPQGGSDRGTGVPTCRFHTTAPLAGSSASGPTGPRSTGTVRAAGSDVVYAALAGPSFSRMSVTSGAMDGLAM